MKSSSKFIRLNSSLLSAGRVSCRLLLLCALLTPALSGLLLAQTPPTLKATPPPTLKATPTPTPANTQDGRGLGLPNSSPVKTPATAGAQTQTGQTRPELVLQTGHTALSFAQTLHFSPDSRLLATTSFNSNQVKLWEVATGRELRTLAISGGAAGGLSFATLSGVSTVAFSRDGRLLAAGGRDNSITIWDSLTGREVQTFKSASSGSITASLGVLALVFSADARQLVSLGDAFRTWDVATGQPLRETAFDYLAGGGSLGFGNANLAVSADGSQLALLLTASPTNRKPGVKIYELASGREVRTVKVSDDLETARSVVLSFTPDGRLLAAALDEGQGLKDSGAQLKLWDLTAKGKARVLATLDRDDGLNLISFSPDARFVALGAGQSVKVWDTSTGGERQTIRFPASSAVFGMRDSLAALAFSRDGKLLATSLRDASLNLWETETGRSAQTLTGRSNYAYNVAFNHDGTRLVSGSKTIWELDAGRGLRAAAASEPFGTLSRDGRLLASTTLGDNRVTLYDASKQQSLSTLTPTEKVIVAMPPVFSPDGRLIATTYRLSEADREAAMQARVGPIASAKEMDQMSKEMMKEMMKNPQAAMQKSMEALTQRMSQQGGGAGQTNIEGQVRLWDTATGRATTTIEVPSSNPITPPTVTAISFTADGRSVAVLAARASHVSLFDATTGAPIRTFGAAPAATPAAAPNPFGLPFDMSMMGLGSGSSISAMSFSADGRLLATGGKDTKSDFDMSAMIAQAMRDPKAAANTRRDTSMQDMLKQMQTSSSGTLKLWDVATGRELRSFAGNATEVQAVALSMDGKILASAAADNLIKLWDTATGRELRTLKGHTAQINSLSFNPDGSLLASAGNDGSTLLWDARTGAQLATLVSLYDGGEWLVVTPDGLFDGSPLAWNQILWRYDEDTFNVAPIEWFFTEFFYPGLLSDLVAGKRPKAAQDFAQKERRQPGVKITLADASAAAGGGNPASVAERNLKLKIEVREAAADATHPKGTGARDLRLFRNGALVKAWRGDVLQGQTSATVDVTIPIVAGQNRLTAYAFNQDNVKSKDHNVLVTGAENLKRTGNAYILAVGVNAYANAQYNLKYAVADARTFGEEVKAQQSRLGRYERIEVVTLYDAQATKANILAALSNMAAQTQPEDQLVIYFAGHGTAQANRFYLIPHDLGYAGSRTRLTDAAVKGILTHSISDQELEAAFEGVNASQIMLVIDACNSGQALEAEEKRRGPMNSKGLAQLAYEKGMYILTAAQSFQAALEASEVGHGLLTFALVEEGLKLSAADAQPRNGEIVVREWFDYATARVPAMQLEKLQQARTNGRTLSFLGEEERGLNISKLATQRPRVFYRRELEAQPLVIARPATK